VPIRNPVHERNDEIESRRQHAEEASKPLDDPGVLLRHHAYRLDDADQDDDEDHERHERKTGLHLPPAARTLSRLSCYEPGWLEACSLSSTSVEPRVPTMYIVLRRAVSLDANTPSQCVPR
jgi:hypothetical protein